MNRSRSALAALVTGLGVLLVQAEAPAAGPPTLTRPVHATKIDLDPGRLYSSPAMAADPQNPLRIVGGWADLRTRRCGLVRSVDGGSTWVRPDASPNTASFPFCSQSQGGVIQAPVAFGGDGMLYMALNGWGTEEAARAGGAVMVARSSDLGDSWDTVVVRSAREKTGEDAENIRPVQSLAVDANGGDNDVVYVTFSPLSDDDPELYGGQFFPNLSIAPNGRVDVAWWDTRDIQGLRGTDAYYAYSDDDGHTWSKNIRLTDQSIDRKLGIWGNNYDIASQPGVASTNAYAVFGWDDTRNSDKDFQDNTAIGGGLQDVYIAAAQFETIGRGSSNTTKVVLAGLVGLLVVGLMLVLAAAVSTRRLAGAEPTTSDSKKAGTKVG